MRPSLRKTTRAVAALTLFIGPLLISSVNIALSEIQRAFFGMDVGRSWVATADLFSVAAVLTALGMAITAPSCWPWLCWYWH